MPASTGTVTELTPHDGLGWITLDDGSRVRFGSTACGGPVPTVGTRVRVVGTVVGVRGIIKATAVERLEPPPRPEAAGQALRNHLARLDALGIGADEVLRQIVGRADRDDAFFEALGKLAFELGPMRADDIDCPDPAFFIIAMDGSGNAYGRYLSDQAPGLPWVFYEHEDDGLELLAADTPGFVAHLLGSFRGTAAPEAAALVRRVLAELGVVVPSGSTSPPEGPRPAWLPASAAGARR